MSDKTFLDLQEILDPFANLPDRVPRVKGAYKREMCSQLIEYMAFGHSFKGALGRMGITESTGNRWLKVYPEWAQAKELGNQCGLFRLERSLNVLATKETHVEDKDVVAGNLKALMFSLKTLHREIYGDKLVVEEQDTMKDVEVPKEVLLERIQKEFASLQRSLGEPAGGHAEQGDISGALREDKEPRGEGGSPNLLRADDAEFLDQLASPDHS